MTPQKADYAQGSTPASLSDVIEGADLFLGLSGPGVLTPEMVARMAKRPIIFALANPTPEILPDAARAAAPDAIIATGRSDFPNQVNNVVCAFRSSSAARSTSARRRSTTRCNWPASKASQHLPAPPPAPKPPPPIAGRRCPSARTT